MVYFVKDWFPRVTKKKRRDRTRNVYAYVVRPKGERNARRPKPVTSARPDLPFLCRLGVRSALVQGSRANSPPDVSPPNLLKNVRVRCTEWRANSLDIRSARLHWSFESVRAVSELPRHRIKKYRCGRVTFAAAQLMATAEHRKRYEYRIRIFSIGPARTHFTTIFNLNF